MPAVIRLRIIPLLLCCCLLMSWSTLSRASSDTRTDTGAGIRSVNNTDASAPVLVIHSSTDWRYVNSQVDVLEDPGRQLDINAVSSPALASAFVPASGPALNFGYSTKAFWIRLQVLNISPDNERLYLKQEFPSIDELQFYQQRHGQWHAQRAGDRVAVSSRSLPFYNPTFEVDAPAGEIRTLYLRVEGQGILKMPLLLLGHTAAINNMRQANMFLGLYFGAMGMMMLYNLGLFAFTRNPLHLYYTAFMTAQTLLLTCWTGVANYLFYPEHPEVARYALLASIGLLLITVTVYTQQVLETRRYHPLAHRLLQLLAVIGTGQIVLVLFDIQPLAGIYSFPATLAGQLIMVFTAITAMRRTPVLGIMFLAGWIVTSSGVVTTGLTAMRWIESSWLTENLFNVGWVIEAFLFSIALAQRTSQAAREKEQSQRAHQRIEQENRAKRLLLEEVSHDLRTPLHGIHGSAELLADTRLTDRQRTYCEQIQASAQNILAVLNNSLAFSRQPATLFMPQLAPCDPNLLAHDLMLMAQPLTRHPGVNLTLQLPATALPPQVLIDRHRIEQISLNLISNALKFTTSGDVCLRLHWRDNWLLIQVEDSGPGIHADQLDRIFEPYERLDSQQPGRGLGLAISRQNAERLGGSLTVASLPGCGSSFSLHVPAPEPQYTAQAEPATAQPAPEHSVEHPPTNHTTTDQTVPAAAQAGTGSGTDARSAATPQPASVLPAGKRILVVDDVTLNRNIAHDLLVLEQQQVMLAADRDETRQCLHNRVPDLVLMDVRLGDDNGIQLVRQLRNEGLLPAHVPVVLMSAAADLYFPEQQLPPGIQAFLPKPVDRERIRRVLAPLLHSRYPLREEMLNLLGAERLAQMVADLQSNLEQQQQDLRNAWLQQDLQRLGKIRHRLEGLAQQLELHTLTAWLQQPGGGWLMPEQLQQQSDKALAEVRDWLQAQPPATTAPQTASTTSTKTPDTTTSED